MRISDFKIRTGEGKPGKNNLITDVAGVNRLQYSLERRQMRFGDKDFQFQV
jgi:L-aminopeptidase/D-esterase-like protein